MQSELYFVIGHSFVEIKRENEKWILKDKPFEHQFYCLANDPNRPGRFYAGTFDNGLWLSNDFGDTWSPVGSGISQQRVLSVAVSPIDTNDGYGVVWAGTEPSGLFRSEDGGETWTECSTLLDLPSKSTWRFPPRPYTHHVRYIQPDIHDTNRIFVGIELGGVMKSEDRGKSWEDRKPGSQFDCHTLTMHPQAEGRIYEAAGGGYAESLDGGKTWQTINDGLNPYTYLVNIAVDAGDPDTIVASAATSARKAYNPDTAETVVVRREKSQAWEIIGTGLPEPSRSNVFAFASNEAGIFYAVNNQGMYHSKDAGKSWERLPVDWPEHFKTARVWELIAI